MVDTASISEEKLKRTPINESFKLADQAIFERRNDLLTLLEITHWIALMEEVTKKSKDPAVLIAAVERVSDILEQQADLHKTIDEQEIVYENGAQVTKQRSGEMKFYTEVTDLRLQQPLLTRNLRYETKSRGMVLEEYQTRLLLQLIQLPGSGANPFENIDRTVSMLQPRTLSDRLEDLPDGYGSFIKEGLFSLYTIGITSQKPDVINQSVDRIRKIMASERLLSNSNTYFKTRGIVALFGRKQEKHFPYLPHTSAREYPNEQRKLWQWLEEFYLRPLQDRVNKLVAK